MRKDFEKFCRHEDLPEFLLEKGKDGTYTAADIEYRYRCFKAGKQSVPLPKVSIAWKTKETKSHGFRILETSQRVLINDVCVLSMITEHGLNTEKAFSPWVEALAKVLAETLNVTLIIEEIK